MTGTAKTEHEAHPQAKPGPLGHDEEAKRRQDEEAKRSEHDHPAKDVQVMHTCGGEGCTGCKGTGVYSDPDRAE